MQTSIQPALRQRQRAMVSNGLAGANNTSDDVLVTLIRNAENAGTIFVQETPKITFKFRGTNYVSPVSGY